MDVELSVPGPAPRRTDPGSCADRNSPNAAALFEAATKVVAATPHSFPLRGKVGLVISSEAPLPYYDEYDAATAIVEVLEDAGFLEDERQLDRHREVIDLALRDGYIVVVKTRGPAYW